MMRLTSDVQIQDDVHAELKWDPEVNSADIGVTVKDGLVTLRGTVVMYREKWAAERDALRISGVRAVTNDLTVTPVATHTHTDVDITNHVADALLRDWSVPKNRIHVNVENGWVTLRGTTDWHYQRNAAEIDAQRVAGVTSVVNEVTIVQPHVSAIDIEAGIKQALVRTAEVDANKITVTVDGAHVTLTGTVQSWAELDAARNAAWRAKGVTHVVNKLVIQV